MTRLVLISDVHDRPASVPQGDVLILAGDIFCGDDMASLRSDLTWIRSLHFRQALMTLGNHDLVLRHLLRTAPGAAVALLRDAGITLLRDEEVEISGQRFYGVDWNSHTAIPAGVDVVISHCPPAGVLDGGIGSPALRRAILAAKPRLHCFGHAHHRGHATLEGIEFYNAALNDLNEPWVVGLKGAR